MLDLVENDPIFKFDSKNCEVLLIAKEVPRGSPAKGQGTILSIFL